MNQSIAFDELNPVYLMPEPRLAKPKHCSECIFKDIDLPICNNCPHRPEKPTRTIDSGWINSIFA